MIKRILVGLAGTRYTPVAIRTAVDLAERHGAEVTGVTVLDVKRLRTVGPVPAGGAAYAQRLREHRLGVRKEQVELAIREFQAACESARVAHRVAQEKGKAFDRMLSLSRYHDLAVFGLRSVFEYEFTARDSGAILARLIRGGVRPLVAVPDTWRPIRRALIAYSGSAESAKTMRRFVQLQPWPDLELRIISFGPSAEEGERRLAEAAEYCQTHGFRPDVRHVPGSPKKGLLGEAGAWQADLIVLGNSARTLLVRRVIGATALHVMRNADRMLFLAQ